MPSNSNVPPEPLLNRRQLQEFLNVSGTTLKDWVQRGVIPPPIRITAKSHRWRRSTINAVLEERGGK
jgi:predicted DNA-binding transcriptional regulator AlpA